MLDVDRGEHPSLIKEPPVVVLVVGAEALVVVRVELLNLASDCRSELD